jgi:hypothetical protein
MRLVYENGTDIGEDMTDSNSALSSDTPYKH